MNPQAWPLGRVRGVTLRDNFGDPRGEGSRTHRGVDIIAPEGTEVRAATPGRVVQSTRDTGPSELEGHYVVIRDAEGFDHVYAHFRDPPLVARGDRVRSVGTRLGFVGRTGDATGPHLHYGVSRPGRDQPGINVYPQLFALLERARGSTMDDAAFDSRMRAARNWTRAFRVPREWWEDDAERRATATAIREEATRQVLDAVRRARAARATGTPEGIAESERLARELARFTGWMNSYGSALARNDTPATAVREAVVSNLASLASAIREGAAVVYDEVREQASSAFGDFIRNNAGVVMFGAVALGWYLSQRTKRG